MQIVPLLFTASWASGINPYLVAAILGIAARLGADINPAFARTDILLIACGLGLAHAILDKIPYVDTAWDVVGTILRPAAAGYIAVLLAQPDAPLPTFTVATASGAIALVTHLAKASLRAAINTSPEPVSNIVASIAEDIAVAVLVAVAVIWPWPAAIAAALVLLTAIAAAIVTGRIAIAGGKAVWRRYRRTRPTGPDPTSDTTPDPAPDAGTLTNPESSTRSRP